MKFRRKSRQVGISGEMIIGNSVFAKLDVILTWMVTPSGGLESSLKLPTLSIVMLAVEEINGKGGIAWQSPHLPVSSCGFGFGWVRLTVPACLENLAHFVGGLHNPALPPIPHHPCLIPLPIPRSNRRTLVMLLLALSQPQQYLRPPAFIEVNIQRHKRCPIARDRAD